MNILMIHTAYNELNLLRYKFEHCKKNNIDLFIIDNMSNDGTDTWLKENNIKHSFIDTNDSFDLRPLLTDMENKIHELKPDWFIYCGVDMFYEAEEGFHNMIENAEKDGFTQIQTDQYVIRNVGEGDKPGNPFCSHFYSSPKYNYILISKYDKSIQIVPDGIKRENILIKQGGICFEMHASKSVEERMETLHRRKKAWKEGLDTNYGSHYVNLQTKNFTFNKSECVDIRELKQEFELYKKLPLIMILQSVHYINEKNTGDMQSCPFEHFSVDAEVKKFHIMDIDGLDPEFPVIIGGGGLLQHGPSIDNIEKIINRHRSPVVIWGAGVNTNGKGAHDDIPDFIKEACLVGIRDHAFAEFECVPCVSCMHPGFIKKYELKNDIVCFEGNKLDLPYPTMGCQDGATMEEILEFLGSAKTIVTSSYHGMYWGVLLKREVIVIPNAESSKFYNLPFDVAITDKDNFRSFIGHKQTNVDDAFGICRVINILFARKVSQLLNIEFKYKYPS